jgi:SNF2 family DNA or RNA helicase
MLDLIAVALNDKGLRFCRIDGQSSLSQRKEAIKKFNDDLACNIMLASIGAAGEGCVTHCLELALYEDTS